MGQQQHNVGSLESARSAAKSVVEDTHDTQQHGVKQTLTQNVTNSQVSGSVKSESGADGCCFGQVRTGKKMYK